MNRPLPPLYGCSVGYRGFFRHDWRWSSQWNGNSRTVLPFHEGTSGICRSGYRCFRCGQFRWDQTDVEFAASMAKALYGVNVLGVLTEAVRAKLEPKP